jgi:phage virion morphogenesis protein
MAGARFDGTAAIEHLSGLVDAINDPSPLLAELGEYGLRSTRERFKTQTAPDGTAWAALQPWYQREKRRNRNRILTLNGYLRGQMTWQLVGDRTVEIGSNLPYAAVHQFGATIKPRAAKVLMFRGHAAKSVTIPARPYLGLSDEDRSEIVERALEWLSQAGRK